MVIRNKSYKRLSATELKKQERHAMIILILAVIAIVAFTFFMFWLGSMVK